METPFPDSLVNKHECFLENYIAVWRGLIRSFKANAEGGGVRE